MMRLFNWLWSLLPDKCERDASVCKHKGIRGNENVADTIAGPVLMCDDCHAQHTKDREWLRLRTLRKRHE